MLGQKLTRGLNLTGLNMDLGLLMNVFGDLGLGQEFINSVSGNQYLGKDFQWFIGKWLSRPESR